MYDYDGNSWNGSWFNLTDDDRINGSVFSAPVSHQVASFWTIVILSGLFFVIGAVGITGNLLVIYVIVSDKRMRRSVTNIFITNLAVSDFIIMVACVPDIVQFVQNAGWTMGLTSCKIVRFSQVFALYASVMTLLSVCVERYVAIIHPIKAHILCSRTRIILIIASIWPTAMICASPNIFFHTIWVVTPGFTPCVVQFPNPSETFLFKYAEFALFYLIPLIIQVVLYVYIGKRLFGVDPLSRSMEPAVGKDKYAATIKARRGVVKMLIAGVTVYFISFSPHQVLLFYNTFSDTLFHETWSYLIFVNIMAYGSSACNPLLYSVFSQKFRFKFRTILFHKIRRARPTDNQAKPNSCKVRNVQKSLKTTVTEV